MTFSFELSRSWFTLPEPVTGQQSGQRGPLLPPDPSLTFLPSSHLPLFGFSLSAALSGWRGLGRRFVKILQSPRFCDSQLFYPTPHIFPTVSGSHRKFEKEGRRKGKEKRKKKSDFPSFPLLNAFYPLYIF